jgi:hypothetical protein
LEDLGSPGVVIRFGLRVVSDLSWWCIFDFNFWLCAFLISLKLFSMQRLGIIDIFVVLTYYIIKNMCSLT